MANRFQFRLTLLFLALFSLAPLLAAQNASNPWEPANRDKWNRPEEVMNELRLRAGSAVADVGCGSGYFTYHLAERVGPQGRVYAVDIEADLIRSLWHQALDRWLVEVHPILGAEDDPHLPRGRLDAILLVHSYHEMHAHQAMVAACYRALKPGGRLAIIEFDAPENQPRDQSYEQHRIPPRTVRKEIAGGGFRFLRTEPGFEAPGFSRKQYFLLFEKPDD